jgi:hypothetical protein
MLVGFITYKNQVIDEILDGTAPIHKMIPSFKEGTTEYRAQP